MGEVAFGETRPRAKSGVAALLRHGARPEHGRPEALRSVPLNAALRPEARGRRVPWGCAVRSGPPLLPVRPREILSWLEGYVRG